MRNKSIIWVLVLTLVVFLSGCGETERFPYADLLTDQEGTYALLVVIDHPEGKVTVESPEVFREFNKYNLTRASFIPKIKDAQRRYPVLEITVAPSFLVFDNKGLVLKTNNEEEVKTLLKK